MLYIRIFLVKKSTVLDHVFVIRSVTFLSIIFVWLAEVYMSQNF